MEHVEVEKKMQRAFRERSAIYRPVCLPTERRFRVSLNGQHARLWLSAEATAGNMQDDASAFEGWALVLMSWCGVCHVTIDWDLPLLPSGHYQRFLYRVDRFAALFGSDVVTVEGADRLATSRMLGGCTPTLNIASDSDGGLAPSRAGSEADLEKRLAGADPAARERLMSELGLVLLDRQMPVGVFDGPPTRAGAIFTGGKSAIDLIGVDDAGALWLLELKTADNIKVGALSELFFYSMVLQDARVGKIVFHDRKPSARTTVTPKHVIGSSRIHARVLSEACHPLLSREVFVLATSAAEKHGWPIDFGYHKLSRLSQPSGH